MRESRREIHLYDAGQYPYRMLCGVKSLSAPNRMHVSKFRKLWPPRLSRVLTLTVPGYVCINCQKVEIAGQKRAKR